MLSFIFVCLPQSGLGSRTSRINKSHLPSRPPTHNLSLHLAGVGVSHSLCSRTAVMLMRGMRTNTPEHTHRTLTHAHTETTPLSGDLTPPLSHTYASTRDASFGRGAGSDVGFGRSLLALPCAFRSPLAAGFPVEGPLAVGLPVVGLPVVGLLGVGAPGRGAFALALAEPALAAAAGPNDPGLI